MSVPHLRSQEYSTGDLPFPHILSRFRYHGAWRYQQRIEISKRQDQQNDGSRGDGMSYHPRSKQPEKVSARRRCAGLHGWDHKPAFYPVETVECGGGRDTLAEGLWHLCTAIALPRFVIDSHIIDIATGKEYQYQAEDRYTCRNTLM